ncbi:E3 ubiquitin-protein ligase RNF6 isoform X1 [Ahaetulla prasina]|uniref:E3 ubiquitin-protein ligase RNF6 isoform X1 n=2 Tax=Ahaetulla prasina TaxID=499056 RepID=UPI00264A3619|nr:E3 ubiquitin-protein ligase RNF6 isoform X1 [Ahaetulla prasina]
MLLSPVPFFSGWPVGRGVNRSSPPPLLYVPRRGGKRSAPPIKTDRNSDRMACSRTCSGENGEQATSQNNSGDNERQWQQERLNREEAYYQFINALSDEDYRLMRDRNLLGTPGEITADELQQRLQSAKENQSSQSEPENREWEDSETLGENITSNSLLEWLNTFHHTGNSTHSGQSGNQSWRAVSQANPSSGEFRFSLEININHEQNNDITPGEQLNEFLHGHSSRMHMENRPVIANSPVASRTRSRTLANSVGHGFVSSGIGNASGLLTQNAEENSRFFSGRLGARSSASSTPNSLLDDNEHNIIRQRRTQRVTPVRYHRGRARTRRNSRQRTEVLRLRSTFRGQFQSLLENGQPVNIQQMHAGANRAHTTQPSTEQPEEQASSLGVTLEEEESVRAAAAASRRHPSITLDLQVRRIRPRENRDRDSIASRTRSRAGMADNLVTLESDNEGFIQNVSRSEYAGIRTYVNTIRIPLHRASDTGLGESSSVAVRSILRQIMTGFGELSSLMDTETGSETERNSQPLSEVQPPVPNMDTLNNIDVFDATSSEDRLTEQGSGERQGETNSIQHHQNNNAPNSRASFVENGTLPILRLVPYLLLEEDSSDNLRGLTKDQIDNLSTRNYENPHSEDDEISKTCSVCINEYVVGNKLRQLPCMHEFHFHCIDRWLSENSTCPICRQPVVT